MLNKPQRSSADGKDTVRVVITGSHGVGKTTLAASLLATLGAEDVTVVPETARLLVAEGFSVNDQMTLEGFLRYIQLSFENARRTGKGLVILDRSLIDLHVYTKDLHSISKIARDLLLELIHYEFRLVDTYIYVPIEFALTLDDIRPADRTYQWKIDEAVRRFLNDTGVPMIEVSGTLADRTRQVIEYFSRAI